jgi:hypothetical protein
MQALRVLAPALAAAAALVAAAGCNPYDPDLGTHPFKCGTSDPRCPDGYTCNAGNVCEAASGDHPDGGGGPADASHVMCGTDVSLEPNDDIAHALQTPVRTTQSDYKLALLAICPSTDIDTYGFTTTQVGAQVTITLTYEPSQGLLHTKLLTRQGAAAGYDGVPSGNDIVITTNRLSIDQWYVQVTADAGVQNNYDLDISVAP